jgi:hypothetical protein
MALYDLEINKGSSFSSSFTLTGADLTPIDLTNYTVSGHVKFRYSDSGIMADLNAAKVAPYTGGVVSLTMLPSGTRDLPITLAVYDVNILHTGSGILTKALYGNVRINPYVG